MTDAHTALQLADRLAFAATVLGALTLSLGVWALVRECRTAPLQTPQGEVVPAPAEAPNTSPVPSTEDSGSPRPAASPSLRDVVPEVTVVTDRPVDEHDLKALRLVLRSAYGPLLGQLAYERAVAGIALDESEAGLDDALARMLTGGQS